MGQFIDLEGKSVVVSLTKGRSFHGRCIGIRENAVGLREQVTGQIQWFNMSCPEFVSVCTYVEGVEV